MGLCGLAALAFVLGCSEGPLVVPGQPSGKMKSYLHKHGSVTHYSFAITEL